MLGTIRKVQKGGNGGREKEKGERGAKYRRSLHTYHLPKTLGMYLSGWHGICATRASIT